ncbi:MAG: hypothetical protein Greene041619_676 [Candidatus Peregrinibacteria bacterium Greene0416_19]|nr:MAG: hypothetical protein Greene041619_676 [Candidatus Peregrinibacteria bacterium Greene0416_19]
MLGQPANARFAPQPNPEREARLLWMANGGTGTSGNAPAPAPAAPPASPATPPAPVEDPLKTIAEGVAGEEAVTKDREAREQQQAIGQTQEETHIAQEQLFGEGETEEEKVKPEDVLHEIDHVMHQHSKLYEELRGAEALIREFTKPGEQEDAVKDWRQALGMLNSDIVSLTALGRVASTIDDYDHEKISPLELGNFLKRNVYPHHKQMPADILVQLQNRIAAHPPEVARNWAFMNDSTKKEFHELPLKDLLRFIHGNVKGMKDEMAHMREHIETLAAAKKKSADTKQEKGGSIFGKIKFYSINNIIEGVKNNWNAYVKTWEQWNQLKVAEVSQRMGGLTKFLPGSESARQALNLDLEHKDEEVKESYKKFLVSDIITFDELRYGGGAHGPALLEINKHDGNRFRGALEYMASKGWLYDINLEVKPPTVMGYPLVPGGTVPGTWSEHKAEEYLIDLDNQNRTGQRNEVERGFNRVKSRADIPPMIRIMEEELKRRNYWAIEGIIKRAIEKGKKGETSTWLSTTIMRYLRDDPVARQYFPRDLMDEIGNIGIQSPAWTTTFFKLDRDEIDDWRAGKIGFGEAGDLASAIALVEKDILAAQKESGKPPLSTQDFDQLVAQVLASQTVGVKEGWKKPISIYNHRYTKYRDAIANYKTTIEPGKCDDDFYNPDNNGSEVQLLGFSGYTEILRHDTTGTWPAATSVKAEYFVHQLIHRAESLKNAGLKEELKTFLQTTRAKMDKLVTEVWNHTNNPILLSKPFKQNLQMPVLFELYRHHLISDVLFDDKGHALQKEAKKKRDQLVRTGVNVSQLDEFDDRKL